MIEHAFTVVFGDEYGPRFLATVVYGFLALLGFNACWYCFIKLFQLDWHYTLGFRKACDRYMDDPAAFAQMAADITGRGDHR